MGNAILFRDKLGSITLRTQRQGGDTPHPHLQSRPACQTFISEHLSYPVGLTAPCGLSPLSLSLRKRKV